MQEGRRKMVLKAKSDRSSQGREDGPSGQIRDRSEGGRAWDFGSRVSFFNHLFASILKSYFSERQF